MIDAYTIGRCVIDAPEKRMILAIEDDEPRLGHLARLLEGRSDVRLIVVCCPACVARHLPGASAVLLDYDLDYTPPGAVIGGGEGLGCKCGERHPCMKGSAYVEQVAARGVPVVVHSANPSGARALVAGLRARDADVVGISALEPDCELRWLGWLWARGAL